MGCAVKMNISPSLKTLAHENIRLDCDPRTVREIWKARAADLPGVAHKHGLLQAYDDIVKRGRGYYRNYSTREIKRELINHAAGFHGVEYLGRNRRTGERMYYCNAGDPYAATLVFHGHVLLVSCWAHFVENNIVRTEEY